MKNYDIIVIGSGAGTKLVTPVAKLGYKVAVIEKESLGGTCLNRGCIPSKMLIHPADLASEIREAHKFFVNAPKNFDTDFRNLSTWVNETIQQDSKNIEIAYSKNENIDFYKGQGKFIDHKVVEVNGQKITSEKILIATGARPSIPQIPGLEGTPFMTSTEALRRTDQPKKMIIIGGGYIAVELGHYYSALGTEVDFVVRGHMISREDEDVIAEFEKVFCAEHKVHMNWETKKVEYESGEFTVTVEKDGEIKKLNGDALFLATGVVPNSDTLDLQATNVKTNERGFIEVNENLETDEPGVYALGDVVGNFMFRHSANFEGQYLYDQLYGGMRRTSIEYPPMPHAIFTRPQVAGVGATEQELRDKKIDYVVGLNPYRESAMGMALKSEHGFVKLLFDRQTRKLLGAHIVGPEASNMIHVLLAYMTMGANLDDIMRTIFIHPALPEIVRNAARKAKESLNL
jgi:dihydrolipoamide dehydrogenase